jgi:hypothetical protein
VITKGGGGGPPVSFVPESGIGFGEFGSVLLPASNAFAESAPPSDDFTPALTLASALAADGSSPGPPPPESDVTSVRTEHPIAASVLASTRVKASGLDTRQA